MHVLCANVHVHPVVEQHPMNTTVCQGDNATFTCVISISSGSIPQIGWLRNGVNVDMMRHIATTRNNRTGNNASPAHIEGTVTVINVRSSDNGVQYQCGIVLFLSSGATLSVAGECICTCVNTYCTYAMTNPEAIMLLVYPLFLPEIPIIFTHYSYFIPMPSPIIPVIFFNFLCQ